MPCPYQGSPESPNCDILNPTEKRYTTTSIIKYLVNCKFSRATAKPKIIIYIAFISDLGTLSLLKSCLGKTQPKFTLSAIARVKAWKREDEIKIGAQLIAPL